MRSEGSSDSEVTHVALRAVNSLTVEELRKVVAEAAYMLTPSETEGEEPQVDVNGGDLVEGMSGQCLALGIIRDESELGRDETRWCPRCAMHRLGEHVEREEKSSSVDGGPD